MSNDFLRGSVWLMIAGLMAGYINGFAQLQAPPASIEKNQDIPADQAIKNTDKETNPTPAPVLPPVATIPSWDGVHQLLDGSTVTVKSGVAIPNSHHHTPPQPTPDPAIKTKEPEVPKNVQNNREIHPSIRIIQSEPWEGQPIVGDSPCQQLVNKVCGLSQQCATTSDCSLAQQSLNQEQRERAQAWGTKAEGWGYIEYMTPTSGQCLASLKETEYFKACPPPPISK